MYIQINIDTPQLQERDTEAEIARAEAERMRGEVERVGILLINFMISKK